MQKKLYISSIILFSTLLIDLADVIVFYLFPDFRLPGLEVRSFPFGFRYTLGIYFIFPVVNVLFTSFVWGTVSFFSFLIMSRLGVRLSKMEMLMAIGIVVVLLGYLYGVRTEIPFLFRILPMFSVIVSSIVGATFGRFLQRRR